MGHELLVKVRRGEMVESEHLGSVLARDANGTAVLRLGEPDAPCYPRSSLKPLQALAMLRSGLDLDGKLLALSCASHSGEPFHLAGAREILATVGLDESALRCTPGLPIGEQALAHHLAAGLGRSSLAMNCSGKHAAMLLTCVRNGWPLQSYLDPNHPLQRVIRDTVEELAGERVSAVTVDGCGAPLFAISLSGLGRAFGLLASAPEGSPEQRVAAAMSGYPEWVAGTGRDATELMLRLPKILGTPGAVAKDGAEGVYALGLPDGSSVALKIADGAARARPVAMVAALRALGVPTEDLADLGEPPVLGHGEPVGALHAAF